MGESESKQCACMGACIRQIVKNIHGTKGQESKESSGREDMS